jgi:hypothetical protein
MKIGKVILEVISFLNEIALGEMCENAHIDVIGYNVKFYFFIPQKSP